VSTQEQTEIRTCQQGPETFQRRDQFIERVLQSVNGAFDVFALYIGDRLGYYTTLARFESLTSGELAAETGTVERYTREWLEQQAVTGVLEVANPEAPAMERCYSLPEGHCEVLADHDSLNFLAPLAQVLVGATRPMDALLAAYRQGGGVPYTAYGDDLVRGQGSINRAAFLQELGQVWLPAMPDVDARLRSNSPARAADIGCGVGWSSIGMALTYPNLQVDGFDLDEASIAAARENARRAGVSDRVRFHVHDAADPALAGQYDLVTAFECLHDMADPVGALNTMRRLANGAGAVLIVDERVAEQFDPQDSGVDAMMYGWSILHCLPVGMDGPQSAATGTVMRPGTLRAYARQAGFQDVEVLPVENLFFRLYRLVA
jgi:hypothetical protein